MPHDDRGVRGVCGRDCLARRTVSFPQTARICFIHHASLSLFRRIDGDGCLFPGGDLRGRPSCSLWWPPSLALYLALRPIPGHSPSDCPTVSARVASVARNPCFPSV